MASPAYQDEWLTIFEGDARQVLSSIPDESVHAVITSPPYWGLRSYGTDPQVWGGDADHDHEWGDALPPRPGGRGNKPGDYSTSSLTNPQRQDEVPRATTSGYLCDCGAWKGELGNEPTPTLYVDHLVEVFREVRRVLRHDGLFFLNIGDSYANDGKWGGASSGKHVAALHGNTGVGRSKRHTGLKAKDLVGIPWRLAFALQDDGWWLRNDIIWSTPNPMPESVTDRFTNSYEHVFMLAKSQTYYFDQDAVREPHTDVTLNRIKYGLHHTHPSGIGVAIPPVDTEVMGERFAHPNGRNRRDVWTIPTVPYKGAHYAVFPPKLVEPMILAATSAKGVCPECGAPWERVTERIREARGDAFGRKDVGDFDHGQAGRPYEALVAVETIGWKPTCEHDVTEPLRDCPECGAPYEAINAQDPWDVYVNPARPQSVRAVEIAREKGLTLNHIAALRAAGLTDAGKAQVVQTGFGNNTDEVQRLAAEAKAALGGYTREFTFLPPKTIGWRPTCEHEPERTVPAVVLDPFAGSGTTAKVAQDHNRRAILIDLNADYLKQQLARNAQVPLGLV